MSRLGVVGDLFVDLIALGVDRLPQWGQDTPCTAIKQCTFLFSSWLNTCITQAAALVSVSGLAGTIMCGCAPKPSVAGGSALNTAMSASAAMELKREERSGRGDTNRACVRLFGAVGRDHFGHTLLSIAGDESAVDTSGAGKVWALTSHSRSSDRQNPFPRRSGADQLGADGSVYVSQRE